MLSEGVVGGSQGKMRRDGVLDEKMDSGGQYGGSDILHPQPCGRAQHYAAPASVTPSFPRDTTMTTLVQGGALHHRKVGLNG